MVTKSRKTQRYFSSSFLTLLNPGTEVLDEKNPGSEMNILNPQHWSKNQDAGSKINILDP
jgi:hypothetical protein